MSAAATPPTPENVAEMLTSGDNDYHDGNYWHPSLSSDGDVVRIGIEAYSEDGEKLPEVHFRAIVIKGTVTPTVVAPEVLAAARVLYRAHVNEGSESTEQAAHTRYEVAAALYALTPDQVAVLAGDDVQAAQAEQSGGAA